MAASRRRTTTTVATAVAAAALAATLATGCDAAHKALDCLRTADAIADDVTDLQQAAEHTALYPSRADASLTAIENDLDRIGDQTGDPDVNKAVDDMRKAVANLRTAIRNGDDTPDISPVTDAAGELTKVCTS